MLKDLLPKLIALILLLIIHLYFRGLSKTIDMLIAAAITNFYALSKLNIAAISVQMELFPREIISVIAEHMPRLDAYMFCVFLKRPDHPPTWADSLSTHATSAQLDYILSEKLAITPYIAAKLGMFTYMPMWKWAEVLPRWETYLVTACARTLEEIFILQQYGCIVNEYTIRSAIIAGRYDIAVWGIKNGLINVGSLGKSEYRRENQFKHLAEYIILPLVHDPVPPTWAEWNKFVNAETLCCDQAIRLGGVALDYLAEQHVKIEIEPALQQVFALLYQRVSYGRLLSSAQWLISRGGDLAPITQKVLNSVGEPISCQDVDLLMDLKYLSQEDVVARFQDHDIKYAWRCYFNLRHP